MRILLAFLLLLTIALPACNFTEQAPGSIPPSTDSSSNQGKTVISFAAWDNERDVYTTLARRFMDEHPQTLVVIVSIDELLRMDTAIQPGDEAELAMLRRIVSGADTAPLDFYVTPAAYGTNLLRDLKPLIDADPTFEAEDFYPGTLERFNAGGGTWVLPHAFSIPVLYYNKALFEQANLPEPQGDWTWDDLLGTATQLASNRGDEVDTYGLAEPSEGLRPLLALLQTQQLDLTRMPLEEWQLEQPEVATEVTRLRELLATGAVGLSPIPPGEYDLGQPQWPQQWIIEGRVGMWSSEYAWQVKYNADGTKEPVTLDFPVGTVPYPAAGMSLFRGEAEGYIISGGTAHPNEAWQWIEFLSRQQTEQLIFGDNPADSSRQSVPARRSLAEETHFWSRLDPATRTTYEQALQAMTAAPAPGASSVNMWDAVYGSLYEALLNVTKDETTDVERELAQAQVRLQDWIAQAKRTPKSDLSPVSVAPPPVQEVASGGTTVRFGIPTYQMGQMRQLVQAFQQQHPDIAVQIIPLDDTTGTIDLATVAQSTDCFSWPQPPETERDFAALADLQPLIDADTTFPRDDYMAALLAPYQHDGKLYGLPYAFTVRVLYYNLTAFRAAGLESPTAAWTPEDFLNAAQALTQGDGITKQYGYVPISGAYTDLLFFINQFGANLTRGSGTEMQPNFDDPQVVEAIQWYIDLYKVHHVMPEPVLGASGGGKNDASAEEVNDEIAPDMLIGTGYAGIWFDLSYGDTQFPRSMNAGDAASDGSANDTVLTAQTTGASSAVQAVPFEVDIAPLPISSAGLTTGDFSVRGFHISAQPENPEACWAWITFLANDVSNLRNEIPARISLVNTPDFTNRSPYASAIVDLYDTALRQPSHPGTNSNLFGRLDPYWFFQAIDAATQGEKELATSLSEAQATSMAYLECLDASTEATPQTCAKQVDPTYAGNSGGPGAGAGQ